MAKISQARKALKSVDELQTENAKLKGEVRRLKAQLKKQTAAAAAE